MKLRNICHLWKHIFPVFSSYLFPKAEWVPKILWRFRAARGALPGSCDRWRCPCWTGRVPHTRMRCCSGQRGWGWAHRWTGRRRCLSGRSAGAPGAQSLSLPCAGGIAPGETRGAGDTVRRNYRMDSTKDTWFTGCFQGWKCFPPRCSNFWAAVCCFLSTATKGFSMKLLHDAYPNLPKVQLWLHAHLHIDNQKSYFGAWLL